MNTPRLHFDAVLAFEHRTIRPCEHEMVETRVNRAMTLRRLYIPPRLHEVILVEDVAVDGASILHGRGPLSPPHPDPEEVGSTGFPGSLTAENLSTFDEKLVPGQIVSVTVYNLAPNGQWLMVAGLGTRQVVDDAREPNTEVTDAIVAGEQALRSAITAWERVEAAERRLMKDAPMELERVIAARGFGTAQTHVSVLRSLLGRS